MLPLRQVHQHGFHIEGRTIRIIEDHAIHVVGVHRRGIDQEEDMDELKLTQIAGTTADIEVKVEVEIIIVEATAVVAREAGGYLKVIVRNEGGVLRMLGHFRQKVLMMLVKFKNLSHCCWSYPVLSLLIGLTEELLKP